MVVLPVRLQEALKGDSMALSPNQIPRIETGDTLVVP
jgi:hypothetical protein